MGEDTNVEQKKTVKKTETCITQKQQNGKIFKNAKNKQPRVPTMIPKKDHHQRVTYLYKLGTLMSYKQLEDSCSSIEDKKSTDTLSRAYINHMNLVSKKSVLKLHPDIKRTICKQCSRLLNVGITSEIRIVNNSKKQLSHCDLLEMKCICGCIKRFPIGKNPDYTLFTEREDIIHDMEGN
jgi:ribonuclease P protein subunit RPR2